MYEIIKDYWKFCDRVGLLHTIDDFNNISLDPPFLLNIFGKSEVEPLITFCRENPDYHIVSCIGPETFINGYIATAPILKLAEGDPNPRIAYNPYGIIEAGYD